jgi:hypothetical protein
LSRRPAPLEHRKSGQNSTWPWQYLGFEQADTTEQGNAMASDSRAHDILSRQAELESERSQYEAVWEAVSEFCDPDAPDVWSGRRGAEPQAERQQRRGAVSTPTPSTRPPTGWLRGWKA